MKKRCEAEYSDWEYVHNHKANDCRARFDSDGKTIKCADCDNYKDECARSVETWKQIDEVINARKERAEAIPY